MCDPGLAGTPCCSPHHVPQTGLGPGPLLSRCSSAAAVGAVFGLVNGLLAHHPDCGSPRSWSPSATGAIRHIGIARCCSAASHPGLLGRRAACPGATEAGWPDFPRLLLVAVLVLAPRLTLIQRLTRIGRYILVIGGDEQIAKAIFRGCPCRATRCTRSCCPAPRPGLAGADGGPTQLGVGDVQVGSGQNVRNHHRGGRGGAPALDRRTGAACCRTLIGVLLISVLANGLILVGVNPSIQRSVAGGVVIRAGHRGQPRGPSGNRFAGDQMTEPPPGPVVRGPTPGPSDPKPSDAGAVRRRAVRRRAGCLELRGVTKRSLPGVVGAGRREHPGQPARGGRAESARTAPAVHRAEDPLRGSTSRTRACC